MARRQTLLLGTEGFRLPLQVVTEPLAVVARRDAGKTYTGMKLMELMLDVGQQVVALDPNDVWWGLRSSADGKSEGYPLVIFGGDHADIDLTPDMGKEVADFVVDEDHSIILVPDFEDGQDLARFMADFLNRIFHRNREPLHLFVDEAETFAPEQLPKYALKMRGAMNKIMKRGRTRGLGATIITQRTASVSKNTLALAAGLFVMGLSNHWDRKPVIEWIRAKATAEQMEEVIESLAGLQKGEGYFWHPEWGIFEFIKVAEKTTFDSSKTPEVGQKLKSPKRRAKPNMEQIRTRLAAAVESAEARDPERIKLRYQQEVAELKRKLSERPVTVEPKEVEVPVEVLTKVEVPVFKKKEIERLEKVSTTLADAAQQIATAAVALTDQLGTVIERQDQILHAFEEEKKRPKAPLAPVPVPDIPRRPQPAPDVEPVEVDGVKLGKGELTVLNVLAEWPEGKSQNEVAFLAGYSMKASTIGVILSTLRKAGFVYPGQPVRLTEAGAQRAGGFRERPRGQALIDHWMNHQKMGGGERKVFQVLLQSYPNALTHEELCDRSGYSPEASTIAVILSNLRKLGLVEKGARRLNPEFMDAVAA